MISEFYNLNLELTDYCNLKCPTCSRIKDYRLQEKKSLDEFSFVNRHSVSLEKYKTWFPLETMKKIKSINFCGANGEPLLNKDFLDIVLYSYECNPDISLSVSTNGSLNNVDWWKELGRVSKKTNLLITVYIDSLKKDNVIYRVGSNPHKILENLDACIQNGGNCYWKMIPFRHNEGEKNIMKNMSEIMGFKKFDLVPINGFEYYENYSYTHKGTEQTIFPSTIGRNYKIDTSITNQQPVENCQAKYEHMREICCRGIVFPCCWVQRKVREFYFEFYETGNIDCEPSNKYSYGELSEYFFDSFVSFFDLKKLSLDYYSFEEINKSDFYTKDLENSWEDNKFCKFYCTKDGRGR